MMTATSASTIPDHIPPELVWDHSIDVLTSSGEDPYLSASKLHDGPDIFWATTAAMGRPGWVMTRYALLQEAYADPSHFSSIRNELAVLGVRLNPLEYDPPEHRDYRKILNPLFSPKAMSALDARVKEVCGELIDSFPDRNRCEFNTEFAENFPSYIFLDLIGMPRDRLPQFLEWERGLIHSPDPRQKLGAMKLILDYIAEFVAEQRANPTTELMQAILSGHLDSNRPLNHDEQVGMVSLLYIGGLDTVFSSMGWMLRHLAQDQPLQQRLRNKPDDIPLAVDELLRAYPVASPKRIVKDDFEFHGVKMRKGDQVLFPTFLAHRDPQAFENPHAINIDRRSRHLAFASGPHTCLGLHLAKRELRTVLEIFLTRFSNIRIPEGTTLSFHTGGIFGLDRLPLQWGT